MSHSQKPAGAVLTAEEMITIVPCGANFSLARIEGKNGDEIIEHIFDPPYRMNDGEDYAFYRTASGAMELWQVECVRRGEWRWVQEAKRAKARWPIQPVAFNGRRVS